MSIPQRKKAARKAPAERAAEIADAARALALEQGLIALTLRAVAARAGVAPALVAHYAPSMDVLVANTFTMIVRAELAEVSGISGAGAAVGAGARLARLVAAALDGGRQDVTVVWVEAWALGRHNEALAAAVRSEMDAWHGLLREVIADGVAAGEFVTDDPASAAWQVLGLIDGLNAQALVRWGAATERGPLVAHAVEGMLGLPRGVLARPVVE